MSRLNTNTYKNKNFYRIEKQIVNAFINLLKTKKIEDINIKEICLEAKVNRTTFYDHYVNIDSLYNKIYDDAFAHMTNALENEEAVKKLFFNPDKEFINHIKSISPYGLKIIKCLINSNKFTDLNNRLGKFLTKLILEKYGITMREKQIVINTILSGVITNVVYSITHSDGEYKYEEIFLTASDAIRRIVHS